ncbi:hypothetical protein NSP_21810 [Nodularia spumigena CCY9414]|nr:hypothetical protein NSP_21810 [Nodularia spumigena CCY9414]
MRCKNPPVLRRKIKAIANIINRTYATIAKNLDLSNRQAALALASPFGRRTPRKLRLCVSPN